MPRSLATALAILVIGCTGSRDPITVDDPEDGIVVDDDAGGGVGYACKRVASSSTSTISGSYCVPASPRCE